MHGESDDWREINAQLERVGLLIKALLDEGDLSSAVLDIAYDFSHEVAAISRTIPARSAFLAGRYGIDIMVSVYPVSSE